MLSPPTCICRTSEHFARLAAAVVLCWFTLLALTQTSTAQDDVKFREFDRNMVHSPRELARDLNYLFLKDKKNPLADIDPEKLEKLRELGENFFENLSDQQKQQAQDFAEQFMREKGLDSPEGQQLMDQLGVSPEMQSELAKEFGDNDPTDFEKFRDLFKNSNRPSANTKNGTHEGGTANRGSGGSGGGVQKSGGFESERPSQKLPRGDEGQGKGSGKNLSKDLFETLPNELKGGPKGKSADASQRGNRGADGKTNPVPNSSNANADPLNPDGISDGDAQSKRRDLTENKLRQIPLDNFGKDTASKRPQRGKGSSIDRPTGDLKGDSADGSADGSKGGSIGGKASQADKSFAKDGKVDQELLDIIKKLEKGRESVDPFADLEKKSKAGQRGTGPSKGTAKNGSKDGAGGVGAGGVGLGESNQDLDETFKSWIQMEAIKEGIRQYREGGGPSEFQRRSLESAFKKGFKGIGDSLGDRLGKGSKGGLSKSEFKDKLDRVLFKAAKDSVQTEGGQDSESEGIGGSVENTLDSLLDRVSEVAKKKQQERRKRQIEQWNQYNSGNSGDNSGAGGSADSFPKPANRPNFDSGDYGTDALGAAADMLENIPELPAFDPQKLLIYLGTAGVAIFLLYLMLRNFSAGQSNSAARKFGRSFQAAKINSPKDLVEAVDYFIVQKFGNRSQWWNAKHAQDVLCAGAPGYSAKITNLLKDYVQARYTRSDVTLSAQEQLNYKKTLQELAKEVPGEPQSPADASQDEG